MNIKKQRQRILKRLAKTEGRALIRRVRYEYKKGKPCYSLNNYELNHLKITDADRLIREYLDKQGIKYNVKIIVKHIPLPENDDIDRIYYDFIDEENEDGNE